MAELRPHYIDVDLKKNTQYNVPVVTQNDTATHFIIRVTDDGLSDPELLDAYQEITMTSQRPDGESFYLTGTRIPGTNEIEFHLGTDETAFSGSVLASLQFYLVEDASRYTSAQFRYDVKKDLTTNYTPTQREETLVEVVLRDGPGVIQEAREAIQAADGAIGRLEEVTEENKTIFREPVATFAALSTTYPNPEHGTTVRVTSESATYRYSDGSWVKTDEYNPTAIDQVAAQLAEKANQIDLNETITNVDATNLRVDNLVIPISPENANVEVTDAHVSVSKNKQFSSIGKRFEESESISIELENALVSREFFVSGWELGNVDATGNKTTSTTRAISRFVKVSPGSSIKLENTTELKGIYLVLYDNSKTFLRYVTYQDIHTISIDGYARLVTGYKDDRGISDLRFFNNKMLVSLEPESDLLDSIINGKHYVSKWYIATVNTLGNITSAKNRVSTDLIRVKEGMEVLLENGEDLKGIILVQYDENRNYLSTSGYANQHTIQDDGYARVVSAYADDRVISDLEYFRNKIAITLNLTEHRDESQDTEHRNESQGTVKTLINKWQVSTLDPQGNQIAKDNRVLSDYIKVNKGDFIYVKGGASILYLVLFDENKVHKEQLFYSRRFTFKDSGYARIISKFEDDRVITDTSYFNDKFILQQSNSNHLFGNFNQYYKSKESLGVTTSDAFNLKTSTINDVYAEYDALLNDYPELITKTLKGYGGDANNVEDTSLPIYEYHIKTLTNSSSRAPKILLFTGLHGDEKSTVWSTLQFIKQMFTHWMDEDNLESLFSNINLKIIPVMNPGGYNADIRTNLNGVDCNRNFSYLWEEFNTPGYNKGTSPYSEIETRIARDWMAENKDAFSFIDFHNTFESFTNTYLDTPNFNLHRIYNSMLRRMSNRWHFKYPIGKYALGEVQGYITNDEDPMSFHEGIIQGIENSAIIEVSRDYNGIEFTSEVIERGVEVIANHLLSLLDAYSKNEIK